MREQGPRLHRNILRGGVGAGVVVLAALFLGNENTQIQRTQDSESVDLSAATSVDTRTVVSIARAIDIATEEAIISGNIEPLLSFEDGSLLYMEEHHRRLAMTYDDQLHYFTEVTQRELSERERRQANVLPGLINEHSQRADTLHKAAIFLYEQRVGEYEAAAESVGRLSRSLQERREGEENLGD